MTGRATKGVFEWRGEHRIEFPQERIEMVVEDEGQTAGYYLRKRPNGCRW
jgi:hypothetical protein